MWARLRLLALSYVERPRAVGPGYEGTRQAFIYSLAKPFDGAQRSLISVLRHTNRLGHFPHTNLKRCPDTCSACWQSLCLYRADLISEYKQRLHIPSLHTGSLRSHRRRLGADSDSFCLLGVVIAHWQIALSKAISLSQATYITAIIKRFKTLWTRRLQAAANTHAAEHSLFKASKDDSPRSIPLFPTLPKEEGNLPRPTARR
jgi:hypothetical protein